MDIALFHITHYKAGSQWIYAILKECFSDNTVVPLPWVEHVTKETIKNGYAYPTVYLDYESFQSYVFPYKYKYFIIFRDLRDTLISLYFSVLKSHTEEGMSYVSYCKQKLESNSFEEGILFLIKEVLPINALIQSSWVEKGEEFIRYEELLENDVEILTDVFLNKLKLPIEKSVLENAIINNRFEKLAKGRKPGEEDQSSHYRKGVKGDWENYFTDAIKARFKEKYGQLLIDTGYEKDLNW